MEWWQQLGNLAAFFRGVPALAADMTLRGPRSDELAYGLARNLTTSPEPFEVYPSEGAPPAIPPEV